MHLVLLVSFGKGRCFVLYIKIFFCLCLYNLLREYNYSVLDSLTYTSKHMDLSVFLYFIWNCISTNFYLTKKKKMTERKWQFGATVFTQLE